VIRTVDARGEELERVVDELVEGAKEELPASGG